MAKRQYSAPMLVTHGAIRSLTQSGSGNNGENDSQNAQPNPNKGNKP